MIHKRFGILRILTIAFAQDTKKTLGIYSGLLIFSCLYQILVYFIGIKIPEFYTVLEHKDSKGFFYLIFFLMALIFGASVCKSGMDWAGGWFSLVVRRSLTLQLHSELVKNLYDLISVDLDNPDQRITQDVDKMALALGYILEKMVISPLLIVYYSAHLIIVDGWNAPLSLFAFFIVSLAISRIVIRRMARVISKKEQKEGDFRFVHLRLLNSVESVCFLSGQNAEKNILDSKLVQLLLYQKYLIHWQMLISFLTGTLDYLGTLISYTVVAVPIFMGSVEPDATVIGKNLFVSFYLLNVFTSIVDLADKYVLSYNFRFAEVDGYGERIVHLLAVFDDFTLTVKPNVSVLDAKNPGYGVFDLCYGSHSKATRPLITNLSFKLVPGTHVIISGSSGCGKSTLLKLLRGFWAPLSGRIVLPSDISFVNSESYFLYNGSVRDQITYPDSGDLISEQEYQQIISDCELGSVLNSYYEHCVGGEGDWTVNLSSGERQLLAFSRILWRKPSFAFLDESTIHMGIDLAERLFIRGFERGITFVVLTHENLGPIFPNHVQIFLDQISQIASF